MEIVNKKISLSKIYSSRIVLKVRYIFLFWKEKALDNTVLDNTFFLLNYNLDFHNEAYF